MFVLMKQQQDLVKQNSARQTCAQVKGSHRISADPSISVKSDSIRDGRGKINATASHNPGATHANIAAAPALVVSST
jgi:hypothetical protein